MSVSRAASRSASFRRLTIVASAALLAILPAAAFAQQATALEALRQRSGADLVVSNSAVTGLPGFLGTRPGHAIALPVAASSKASDRAAAFLEIAAPSLGLRSAQDVRVVSSKGPDEVGMEHVRFQQTHEGVPVAGAELIVHLRGASAVSVNGLALPDIEVSTTPALEEKDAAAIALAAAEAARKTSSGDPISLSDGRLELLSVGFYQRRTLTPARLAWFFEATAMGLRELLWVDAESGKVLQQFNQLTDARNRLVHSAGGGSSLPGTLIRSEGSGPSGDVDVNYAYDYSGDTYDYFSSEHGRDSFDDSGATLSSTVDWCDAGLCGSCPCQNAFWDGTQMIYGDGFPAADDVVAHELTHAVTEYTAGLVYCMQPGALNESFSDIFGEAVDLLNTGGTDTPAARWLLGEDVPGFGAIRNMSSPNDFDQPARVSDPLFFCATSCGDFDNGGVHINSGVPNHAFALMVDGGTYNSITVTGIGLSKAGKVHYRALTEYLSTSSSFVDAYNALVQSCTDLVGTAGITAGDCTEVTDALQAVEMDVPACVPSECGNGSVEGSETCDDSNLTNCDGCDANCQPTGCGNGLTACGEVCDDGNLTGGDGCEADCTLSPGCSIYSASGLPATIPDQNSVSSIVTVPASSEVLDVNLLDVTGTHTYVGDLEFHLMSPAGTDLLLVNNVCGGSDDFAFGLDDEASSTMPCPPTDSESHLPSLPLSTFDGQDAAGNWTLTIYDQQGGDSGTLQSWDLMICSSLCGDGSLDPGEDCDDSNLANCDGCDSNCKVTGCGNGMAACGEQCDDGNLINGDGCESDCTLAAGCVLVTPTDLPQGIYDYGQADSYVNVLLEGLVTDVAIVDLAGTHTYTSDLRFELVSPQGVVASVMTHVCGSSDNFDLGLDDDAATPIPCPPTDGNAHIPSSPLSVLDGTQSDGTWRLSVRDMASGDEGALESWGLVVCAAPACEAEPLTGCETAGTAQFSVTDSADDAKDSIKWKWGRGSEVLAGDLGDPTSSTRYSLCVYDRDAGMPSLVTTLSAPTGVTWSNDLPKGVSYRDRYAATDGLQKISVRTGVAGKSKAKLGAKGVNVPMRVPFSMTQLFDSDPNVTVQLVNSDGACWTTDFTTVSKNTATLFKAKQP